MYYVLDNKLISVKYPTTMAMIGSLFYLVWLLLLVKSIDAVEIISPIGKNTVLDIPAINGRANANVQAPLQLPPNNNPYGCSAFAADATGAVILVVQSSSCSVTTQAQNAKNANAAGLVIGNGVTTSLQAFSTNVDLPTVFIGFADFTELTILFALSQLIVRISTFVNCFNSLPTVSCQTSGICPAHSR